MCFRIVIVFVVVRSILDVKAYDILLVTSDVCFFVCLAYSVTGNTSILIYMYM